MTKRFILFLSVCLVTSLIHAQEWTKKDSLNLHDLLHGNGEIKLNPEAVKQIDFDSGILGAPQISTDKNWMLPDETLPSALPDPFPSVPSSLSHHMFASVLVKLPHGGPDAFFLCVFIRSALQNAQACMNAFIAQFIFLRSGNPH